jgi:hypothetical protein
LCLPFLLLGLPLGACTREADAGCEAGYNEGFSAGAADGEACRPYDNPAPEPVPVNEGRVRPLAFCAADDAARAWLASCQDCLGSGYADGYATGARAAGCPSDTAQ